MTNEIEKRNYCEETLSLKRDIEVSFLDLGERLQRIRDDQLYFPSWDTFEDFMMEMKMSAGTASKLINIYQRFVLEYKISTKAIAKAGGWSIVAECLSIVKSKEEAVEWIEKASLMTQTDIRREIKEAKTGIPMSECKHDWVSLRFCKCCGLRERTYEDESKTQ
jgi:hypothetical protein